MQIPKNEIRVGDGWLFAAPVITGRAGVRARRLRAHFHRAAQLIDPDNAAASTADRLNIKLRHEKGVLVDSRFRRGERLAVTDDAHVETGATDVRGNDMLVAEG